MEEICYLAVYGTLRTGGVYNHIISEGEFVCSMRVANWCMYDNKGQYPFAVRAGGDSSIVVELWAVTAGDMEKVDDLEEYPDLYNKTFLELETGAGSCIRAAFYYVEESAVEGLDLVPGGDWIMYL